MKTPVSNVSRRQFLQRAALLASAAATAETVSAITPATPPVIDTHIHLYDPNRPGGIPWPPPSDKVLYSPHLLPQFANATEGINIAGVMVIEANAGPSDNRWVLELAKDNPLIVGYIARLVPGQPDFAANFDAYAGNPIFRGLRLREDLLGHAFDTAAFENDLKRTAEHKLSLDLVGGPAIFPTAARLRKLAPEVPLIIDHLPFGDWDSALTAMRPALKEVAALPNVFAKVSLILRRPGGKLVTDPEYYRPRLDILWEMFGEDRVLYGSNWPVSDVFGSYADVYRVAADYAHSRGRAAAAKFFWKNSIAAYHWQPRGAAAHLRG